MATIIEEKLPAGEYLIIDLCYVMHKEWKEICNIICANDFDSNSAILKLDDGRIIAMAFTKYGDGEYYDQNGKRYGVDAGLIGAILLSDVSEEEQSNIKLGNVYTLNEFSPVYNNGKLSFDSIVINTDEEEEEDDYWSDDYDTFDYDSDREL
jgi:hypothetical protein